MSDISQTNETETTVDDLGENPTLEQVREALKRETKRRKDAEKGVTDLDAAKREIAFLRAGVDDSNLGKLFVKGYDGELDPEAIKKAWAEIAPSTPEPPSTPSPDGATGAETDTGQLTEEQIEQLRRSRQGLQSESSPPGQEPRTPYGQAIMDAAYERQGGARVRPPQGMNDAALNAGFSVAFGRAAEGDPEAVFKRPDESWADATQRWRESQG